MEGNNRAHSADADAPAAPAKNSDSATEQLAQLTLDSLPGWMKAPGGIQRFRSILAMMIVAGAIILGVLIFRQAYEVRAAISAPHREM